MDEKGRERKGHRIGKGKGRGGRGRGGRRKWGGA